MRKTLRERIEEVVRRAKGDPVLAAKALCLTLDGFGDRGVAAAFSLSGNGWLDDDQEMLALHQAYLAQENTPATRELEPVVGNFPTPS